MLLKRFLGFGIFCCFVVSSGNTYAQEGAEKLTLGQCVRIALDNNSDLLNAERRMKIAGTNVVSARSAVLPSINSSFSSGRFRQSDRTVDADVPVGIDPTTGEVIYERRTITQPGYYSNSNQAQLSFSQLLFDFGTSWTRISQASANEKSSEKSYESTKQSTILLVYQRYFGYLKELQLQKVYDEAAKSSEEQLKRTESMYEIGSVAQGDVYRARTTYGNDRINLITQNNQVVNTRALLNVVMGRPADASLEIVDIEEEAAKPRSYTMDEVIQSAIANNPDLQSYKYLMQAANLGKRMAKTSYLPTVSLSTSYSRSHNQFDRVYSDFSKNWFGSVGLSVRFNLFNGFADQANYENSALSYRVAEESYINRTRNLRLEAEQALLSLQAYKEITDINNDNLLSAQEDLRLAQERYRVGAGTLLDVITAQANFTRAKATLVSAKYNALIADAQLQATMGILK